MTTKVIVGSGAIAAGASPNAPMPLDPAAYDDAIPIRLKGGRKACLTLPKPLRETYKMVLARGATIREQ